jgi:hypothetical protein
MRTNDSFHVPRMPLSFLVLTSPLHGLEMVTCMTLLHPDDATRAKELPESSRKGSRYGQFCLGYLLEKGPDARLCTQDYLNPKPYLYGGKGKGDKQNVLEAARLYRLAGAQGHDIAQNNFGRHVRWWSRCCIGHCRVCATFSPRSSSW